MSLPRMRYYIAVFGDPGPEHKDPVEDGHYEFKRWVEGLGEGHAVLLYCAGSYPEYSKSIPGIGIVTSVNSQKPEFWYHYLPITPRLPLDDLKQRLMPEDERKLSLIRFDTFWVFEIQPKSFTCAIAGLDIVWP